MPPTPQTTTPSTTRARQTGNTTAVSTTKPSSTTRKSGSTRKSSSAKPKAAQAAPAPAEGAIGTSDNLSKEGKTLLAAIRKAAGKRDVTTRDYGGGNEVMVKIDGVTAVYLIQKTGSTDVTARYRQKGLNLKGIGSQMTPTQAAKEIVKHLDARPPRKTREVTPAAVSKSGSRSKTTSARKSGSGGKKSSARKSGDSKKVNGPDKLLEDLKATVEQSKETTTGS